LNQKLFLAERTNPMTLQEALSTSDYFTAQREQDGYITTVEISDEGGYDVAFGVDGMPTQDYSHAKTLSEIKDAEASDWLPIGEQGEPQE
jgi:hypothetical protein